MLRVWPLVLILACQSPNEPRDRAILSDGWWYVTLSNGQQCIARPYLTPERDTAAEAIAECRAASH